MVLFYLWNEFYVAEVFKRMKNKYFILFSIMALIFHIACEDDPLLAPQSEPEEDGGSYGNLSLPGVLQDGADKNPEIF